MPKAISYHFLFLLAFIGISGSLHAQIDSTETLNDVVVTGFKTERKSHLSYHITSLKMDSLSRFSSFTLTDDLTREPGVSAMTTGLGISKPVIRGLFGSRVLVLISGLKFDNQQWQDEHGMGMSSFGLDRVEVVKSPMSVLYGSDAIGGLLNTIEEIKPSFNTTHIDYSLKFNSNTLGGLAQYGLYKNNGGNWWRIRVGLENHGDYSDGSNKRVLNSRFDGYYLKSTYGFRRKNWISENHWMSTYNRYGFIFKGIYDFVEADERWSRKLNYNPAHLVLLNVLSSENTLVFKDRSTFKLNMGGQSNERMENEGSGTISLNMHLLTFQYLANWEKTLTEKHKFILSSLGSWEKNQNYGSRKIVPNANLGELNLSAYVSSTLNSNITWENSFGIGGKWISTFPTEHVNSSEKEITPFKKSAPYWNFLSGIAFGRNKVLFKLNFASGVRIPNLAELSSDGLHEGIYTYEIGDPNLKFERTFGLNALVSFTSRTWSFTLSPFVNRFNDFVYLAPTSEDWFGFPVFRYKQQNAFQWGSEVSVEFKSSFATWKIAYEGVASRLDNGEYTPFIPAQRVKPSVTLLPLVIKNLPIQLQADANICFDQTLLATEESFTSGYVLLNAGAHTHWNVMKRNLELGLYVSNILNTKYVDHLSRLKNYGVNNMGINFTLFFKVQLDR